MLNILHAGRGMRCGRARRIGSGIVEVCEGEKWQNNGLRHQRARRIITQQV